MLLFCLSFWRCINHIIDQSNNFFFVLGGNLLSRLNTFFQFAGPGGDSSGNGPAIISFGSSRTLHLHGGSWKQIFNLYLGHGQFTTLTSIRFLPSHLYTPVFNNFKELNFLCHCSKGPPPQSSQWTNEGADVRDTEVGAV